MRKVDTDATSTELSLVYISWRDHYHEPGWSNYDDFDLPDEGVLVRSCGFLIYEDKVCLKVAQSFVVENESLAHVTIILKNSIVNRVDLGIQQPWVTKKPKRKL